MIMVFICSLLGYWNIYYGKIQSYGLSYSRVQKTFVKLIWIYNYFKMFLILNVIFHLCYMNTLKLPLGQFIVYLIYVKLLLSALNWFSFYSNPNISFPLKIIMFTSKKQKLKPEVSGSVFEICYRGSHRVDRHMGHSQGLESGLSFLCTPYFLQL